MLISNILSNRIDNFVNSFDEEDIISHRQTKNATRSQQPSTRRNKIVVYSKREEWATRRNRIAEHSKKREEMDSINKDMSEIRFFNQERTKYNS